MKFFVRPLRDCISKVSARERSVSRKDADHIMIGRDFVGLLFTGIMLTKSARKSLNTNARLGEPETQSIIPLLHKEVDLAEVMIACI